LPHRAEVDAVLAFPKGSVGAAMDRDFMGYLLFLGLAAASLT
jgi:hypothetical protein